MSRSYLCLNDTVYIILSGSYTNKTCHVWHIIISPRICDEKWFLIVPFLCVEVFPLITLCEIGPNSQSITKHRRFFSRHIPVPDIFLSSFQAYIKAKIKKLLNTVESLKFEGVNFRGLLKFYWFVGTHFRELFHTYKIKYDFISAIY